MGLPEILIEFKTKGTTAVQRSARGIVALVLKDDKGSFDTKIYNSIDELDESHWSPENLDYIEKTFWGTPNKVIVERLPLEATDYNTALARLKNKKWNWLSIPGTEALDTTNIAAWIKQMRDVNHKTFKAVLPNEDADHEGIVNFATSDLETETKTYNTAEYTSRIAGILAGMPFTRSATYYGINELKNIKEHEDPDKEIDDGKLILINDGEVIKIGRGVNSLTTTTATKGEEFKKIKIVEGVDLVRDDIRDTFEKHYAGKVNNIYDNKILFLAAVNSYFGILGDEDVLDPSFDNKAEIDVDAQRIYLKGKGIDVDNMKEQEIKEANTGSKVFAKANVKFIDAMEDLKFTVFM